ncbi:MAG: SRPBCC family protein [Phycisphaerales bacterium]
MTTTDRIAFDRDGRDILLHAEQDIPRPLDEVFPFFADAHNLQRITPPNLRFRILTPPPIDMREGALIDYRISLRGFPMRWRTRITKWSPPHEFEDTQLRGPYSVWIHTHTFRSIDCATRMADTVRYRPPLGHLGRAANRMLIERDLRAIFEFRRDTVREIFAPPDRTRPPE